MQRTVDIVENFWDLSQLEEFSKLASINSRGNFVDKFSEFLGIKNRQIKLWKSGSYGLEYLLKNRSDHRKTVLAPAFNCITVRNAVIKSGYRLRTYGFSDKPGHVDWRDIEKLIDGDVGVVIVTHFFGLPVNFSGLASICHKKGISIIEDCAHTLGGKVGDNIVGTIGDAAIFSFNYDKPISLCWGGLSVINNDEHFSRDENFSVKAPELDEELYQLINAKKWLERRKKRVKIEHRAFYRLYKKLFRRKDWRPSVENINSIGSIQAEIGIWSLSRYNKIMQQRNINAERILQGFKGESWYKYPNTEPAYLRAKLKMQPVSLRKEIITKFRKNGFRVGTLNWPITINDVTEIVNPVTIDACKNWIDVPIHQNLSDSDVNKIKEILASR